MRVRSIKTEFHHLGSNYSAYSRMSNRNGHLSVRGGLSMTPSSLVEDNMEPRQLDSKWALTSYSRFCCLSLASFLPPGLLSETAHHVLSRANVWVAVTVVLDYFSVLTLSTTWYTAIATIPCCLRLERWVPITSHCSSLYISEKELDGEVALAKPLYVYSPQSGI